MNWFGGGKRSNMTIKGELRRAAGEGYGMSDVEMSQCVTSCGSLDAQPGCLIAVKGDLRSGLN